MNLIGLFIGILFWILVLFFIPGLPYWVRIGIYSVIVNLLILFIKRGKDWIVEARDEGKDR